MLAEMLRVFMRPRNHIAVANFWEFPNEYWGAVRGFSHRGEPLVPRPQYYPFALYHEHFGPLLLDATVDGPAYETAGGCGVLPAAGAGSAFRMGRGVLKPAGPWVVSKAAGVEQSDEAGTLAVRFDGPGDINYYHARVQVPVEAGRSYRLTGWVRTAALTGTNGACFQVGDARGWVATRSAAVTPGITGTHPWTRLEVDYTTLPDARAVEVVARRLDGGGPVDGRAWYRDVSLRPFTPRRYPAVPVLGANASRSADGRAVWLMVVNKRQEGPVQVSLDLVGFRASRARAWVLSGPTIDATNEVRADNVAVRAVDLGDVSRAFTATLPPHSLTAIEVRGRAERLQL